MKAARERGVAKIKSVKKIGIHQTYDLEVDHPDHQFYLANGILTSNSHSISYSHVSYYTAWLKCHYPTQFMCALLNGENPNSDKALEYINECKKMGINITPPNINTSGGSYVVTGEDTIATGLSAIKGIGDKAVAEILEMQPFSSIEDFFYRTNGRVINKTVIQSLAMSGAFEALGRTRKDIFENFQKYRTKINNMKKKEKSIDDISLPAYNEEWERKELLLNERDILGRTISGSLHEVFPGFFTNREHVTPLRKIPLLDKGDKVKIEVILNSKIKEFKIKRGKSIGKKFAKYLIQDVEGTTAELTLWTNDYEKYKHILNDGVPLKALCKVDEYMENKSLSLLMLERILEREI